MNRPLFALALFLFVWPAVTVLSATLEAASIPVAVRTFLTSVVLVPAMVFAVAPALTRLLAPRN